VAFRKYLQHLQQHLQHLQHLHSLKQHQLKSSNSLQPPVPTNHYICGVHIA